MGYSFYIINIILGFKFYHGHNQNEQINIQNLKTVWQTANAMYPK